MMSYRSIFRPDLFGGRVVLITGGGSGLGRCVAHELSSLGATVVLVGRKRERLAAVEWASHGVRVNAVAPGFINTEALARYGQQALEAVLAPLVPLGRLGTESEVSAAICFLLSEGAAYISGATLQIDGAAPSAHPLFPPISHDKSPIFNGFHRGARNG